MFPLSTPSFQHLPYVLFHTTLVPDLCSQQPGAAGWGTGSGGMLTGMAALPACRSFPGLRWCRQRRGGHPVGSVTSQGHVASEPPSVCVSAALPSQGELRGGESAPAEPDPAAESAEPDAPGTEHREQGAVPRGTEAVHVSGPWAAAGGASTRGPSPHSLQVSLFYALLNLPQPCACPRNCGVTGMSPPTRIREL